MTKHHAGRSGGGMATAARFAAAASCPAVLSRIAIPRIFARPPNAPAFGWSAVRGSAWLQENAREHEIRLPQSKARLP